MSKFAQPLSLVAGLFFGRTTMSDQGWLQKFQAMFRTGQLNDAAVGAGSAAQAAQQLSGRGAQVENALAKAMQQQPQLTVEQILELQRMQAQNTEQPKPFQF